MNNNNIPISILLANKRLLEKRLKVSIVEDSPEEKIRQILKDIDKNDELISERIIKSLG